MVDRWSRLIHIDFVLFYWVFRRDEWIQGLKLISTRRFRTAVAEIPELRFPAFCFSFDLYIWLYAPV